MDCSSLMMNFIIIMHLINSNLDEIIITKFKKYDLTF